MSSTAAARPLRIAVVLGTRPEAIKLAPIVLVARRQPSRFDVVVVSTGQHRDMACEALAPFGLEPDVDLCIMEPRQSPTDVLAKTLARLPAILAELAPDVVLVQGDTSTTLAGALTAHHLKIPVGHVEAGLRTDDRYSPFPEEMNRRLTSRLATYHFAPTPHARDHLLRENVPRDSITVTGNSGIDALYALKDVATPPEGCDVASPGRMLLLTCHRRENHGRRIREVCEAVADIVVARDDAWVVCPVHPSPAVATDVEECLRDVPRVRLLPPVRYQELVWMLQRATVVLTDSGGIQEEAPAFGKPVLVLRESTERPEGVEAGVAKLVGTDRSTIVKETLRLLDDGDAYARMAKAVNPYGDGRASGRILEFLAERLGWRP